MEVGESMREIGQVVAISGDRAVIEVQRASACGENCAHCMGGCMPTRHRAVVKNPLGAAVGDRVKIEAKDKAIIRSAFLVYIVPILISFLTYGLAQGFGAQEVGSMCAGLFGLVLSFCILNRLDKKMAPVPEITQILYREGGASDGT